MLKFFCAIIAVATIAACGLARADAVDDCMRDCSVSRGSCDFDPSDPGRAAGCRDKADSCKWECELNGSGRSSRAPQYGAIAYSPSTRAQGFSHEYGDRESAESAALNACRQRSGAGDCRSVLWFFNSCGALATASDGTYGSGWSGNKIGAETRALYGCRNEGGRDCAVQRSFCTGL